MAFLLPLVLAAAPPRPPRVALLVGDDSGLTADPPLHHTGADVDRLAAVLTELGHFDPGDVVSLKNATGEEILAALDGLAARSPGLVVFYYSGHADEGALRAEGTRLPLATLLAHFSALPAALRVGILDACQSGAATEGKGVSPGPAFDVRLDDRTAEGQVVISSSSREEQSFESEELRGALFTLHLVTGLRGAADQNGDGQVSLGEAYAYAYTQTLRATLLSRMGPQHPTFRWDFGGQRDPILTELSSAARLALRSTDDGDYVLFNGLEREVIAELPSRAGATEQLALAPGEYAVKHRGPRDLREARIRLATGDDRILDEANMPVVPLVRLSRKQGADLAVFADVSNPFSPLTNGYPYITVGLQWQREQWTSGLAVLGTAGATVTANATSGYLWGGLNAEELRNFRLPFGFLRVGPTASALLLSQATSVTGIRVAPGAILAARLQLEVNLLPALGLYLTGDAGGLATHLSYAPAGGVMLGPIGVVRWITAGLGFHVSL